jgi:lipoprotein-anchoring transpeptidase ErfK/SrfK
MPRSLRITLWTILTFAVLLTVGAGGIAAAYYQKTYPNIKVGSVKVGSVKADIAQQKITDQVTRYLAQPVTVTLPDITQPRVEATGNFPDLEVKTTAAELGLQFNQEDAQKAVWEVGHTRNVVSWVRNGVVALFRDTNIPLAYQIEPGKIDTFVSTQILPKIVTPTPAKIHIDGETIAIDDAKPGLSVDTTALSEQLAAALPNAIDGDPLFLAAPVHTEEANVTRVSLQPVADHLTTLSQLQLSLQNGESTLRPTKAQLLAWFSLVQDDKGAVTIVINSNAISSYLKSKGGSTVDVDASLKLLNTTLSSSIAELDQTSLTKPLKSRTVALAQKPVVNTEPEAGSYTLSSFPGKYVEVNLKEQKLYRINGGTLEKVYRVSTGKWSTPTPVGSFTITYKTERAYSHTFGLYMPYWMNFTGTDGNGQDLPVGSYGLHELPEWPNGYKEGASHIGTPVSHGCVRLGVGDAAEMYGWADVGTPVIIH